MRGDDKRRERTCGRVNLGHRLAHRHALRSNRDWVGSAPSPTLSAGSRGALCQVGRPCYPPQPLQAPLTQTFSNAKSGCRVMEQLDYNVLSRSLLRLSGDEPLCNPSGVSNDRARLLCGGTVQRFLALAVGTPRVERKRATDCSSVDGTLVEEWVSDVSCQLKESSIQSEPPSCGRISPPGECGSQRRSNAPLACTTDARGRPYRRGNRCAPLAGHKDHVPVENRAGASVDGSVGHRH